MATVITLEGVKREPSLFRTLAPTFEATFSFRDGSVVGSLTVSLPVDMVTEVELVGRAREHLREVFLHLADEVIRPQDLREPVDTQEEPTAGVEEDRDPSETASEVRGEQIAAAKLLIAVKHYANGTVPGAEMLPTAREDSDGLADFERFASGVSSIVHKSAPDGFGGANTFLNLHIGSWLKTNYSHEP